MYTYICIVYYLLSIMYYCPYICLCFIWTQQSDYLLCYHSFGKTIITIFNIVNCCSLRSCCNDSSGSLLVLGLLCRQCWHSYPRNNNNIQLCNFSCCNRSLWLLLCRACCVSKHLYCHGKSESIPWSALSMVNISKSSRLTIDNRSKGVFFSM